MSSELIRRWLEKYAKSGAKTREDPLFKAYMAKFGARGADSAAKSGFTPYSSAQSDAAAAERSMGIIRDPATGAATPTPEYIKRVEAERQSGYEQQYGHLYLRPAMSEADLFALDYYKRQWEKAKRAGDAAAMAHWHGEAEKVRAKYGFSGGASGDETIPLEGNPMGLVTVSESFALRNEGQPLPAVYGKAAPSHTARANDFYDIASDPLYQIYAERYAKQGKAARDDALIRHSSQTGGIPSSYAQAAAAQIEREYEQGEDKLFGEIEKAARKRYSERLKRLKESDEQAYRRAMAERELQIRLWRECVDEVLREMLGLETGVGM